MKNEKIYISGDHAGFKLKNRIKKWLEKKYEVKDFGPLKYDENDDFPDFVIPMAKAVKKNKKIRGLIIAGSGIGETISVNRIKGIFSIAYHGKNLSFVKMAREHDDINILCIGANFVKEVEIKKAINVFLKTKFKGGRHLRRLNKIKKMV